MTTKTLSVTDDVYQILKRMKLKGESFSDTIRRLTERGSVADCAGLWSSMTDEELRKVEDAIAHVRSGATSDLLSRMGKV
jgi:predicted CopG family antitoxin